MVTDSDTIGLASEIVEWWTVNHGLGLFYLVILSHFASALDVS